MAHADRRERDLDRAVLDFVEAAVLERRVGETFGAVVTAVDGRGATVQLAEPAVRARLSGPAPLGERITVRLANADPATRTVAFEVA
jgi:exoribonuclease R